MDATQDPALAGLTSDFSQQDINSGINGDGSVPTQDLFEQIINSKTASAVVSAGVTALLGPNKVIQNTNGTYQPIPGNQQGGTIGDQSQVQSWTSKIPKWGLVVVAVVAVVVVIKLAGWLFGRG